MQRTPARASAARPADKVTSEELARAAELEAAILAEEQAAEQAQRKGRDRDKRASEGAIYSSVPLAERAAVEYGYVQRDIRRIALVGGSLLAILAILHVLVNVANVI
jgi:hypothetical protein